LGFITPMPILGDEQASGLRREILRIGAFTKIEAFPQKDNPDKRVFRDAKLSTAIIGVLRTSSEAARSAQFHVRVHPENTIHPDSPDLLLSSSQIPLYDPGNMTIVSCSQHDWALAVRLMASGHCARLGDYCTSHQGEVNEKTDEGLLEADPSVGPLVLRGANISLYALREASQGEALYIRESEFLEGRTETSRALQSRERRIGFQRSSPQNNFRRLIACLIPRGQYCFDTVSYIPESETRLPMPFVLALLNSKLLDWYFRLGSTNSKVNEYQFNILPCPVFTDSRRDVDDQMAAVALEHLNAHRLDHVIETLAPGLAQPPFSPAVRDTMVAATWKIMECEAVRSQIPRAERSHLSPHAQPYQDLIDSLIFTAAGLSPGEGRYLDGRLRSML
jgi:hypothetical protein